jgi:tRNA nucleotidyltransferase (CCA-adding enzyme)
MRAVHPAGFELTEHTADVGVRAWGPSAADVFEQAALGMASLMYDVSSVAAEDRTMIELGAADGELLLTSWLNELLYVIEARRVVFSRFEIVAVGPRAPEPASGETVGEPWRLVAAGVGEALDARRHAVRGVVKAATLHSLELKQTPAGWRGHVLLDV